MARTLFQKLWDNHVVTEEPGEPALLNQSPLDKGWLFRLKPANPSEADALMDWNAYQDFIKQSAH